MVQHLQWVRPLEIQLLLGLPLQQVERLASQPQYEHLQACSLQQLPLTFTLAHVVLQYRRHLGFQSRQDRYLLLQQLLALIDH